MVPISPLKGYFLRGVSFYRYPGPDPGPTHITQPREPIVCIEHPVLGQTLCQLFRGERFGFSWMALKALCSSRLGFAHSRSEGLGLKAEINKLSWKEPDSK